MSEISLDTRTRTILSILRSDLLIEKLPPLWAFACEGDEPKKDGYSGSFVFKRRGVIFLALDKPGDYKTIADIVERIGWKVGRVTGIPFLFSVPSIAISAALRSVSGKMKIEAEKIINNPNTLAIPYENIMEVKVRETWAGLTKGYALHITFTYQEEKYTKKRTITLYGDERLSFLKEFSMMSWKTAIINSALFEEISKLLNLEKIMEGRSSEEIPNLIEEEVNKRGGPRKFFDPLLLKVIRRHWKILHIRSWYQILYKYFFCPNIRCPNIGLLSAGDYCPTCGTLALGFSDEKALENIKKVKNHFKGKREILFRYFLDCLQGYLQAREDRGLPLEFGEIDFHTFIYRFSSDESMNEALRQLSCFLYQDCTSVSTDIRMEKLAFSMLLAQDIEKAIDMGYLERDKDDPSRIHPTQKLLERRSSG